MVTGVPSEGEVQAKIQKFEQRFNDLKKYTQKGLESRRIDVKAVVTSFTNLPADDKEEHKVFLEKHIHDLFQAESHEKLFALINIHYWNYLAYHLLEHLIKEFSVEEVKGEMKTYKSDLEQFMRDTPLEVFCETQKRKILNVPEGFEKLVVKFTWPKDQKVTLEKVEEYRQQYAYHYNLREFAMMLITVQPGSFTAVWYIPESIVQRLKKEMPQCILSKYAVTELEIAGACVYKKVNIFCPVYCSPQVHCFYCFSNRCSLSLAQPLVVHQKELLLSRCLHSTAHCMCISI